MSIYALILGAALLIGCNKHTDNETSAATSASASSTPAPKATPCESDTEGWEGKVMGWGPDFVEHADALTKAATQKIAAWTTDCRQKALVDRCEYGCDSHDDVISALINASPTSSEKQAALKYRLDRNMLRATKWREVFSKTKGFVELAPRHCNKCHTLGNCRASNVEADGTMHPRGTPCSRRRPELDPNARQHANDADDAKIYAVWSELDHDDKTQRFLQAPVFVPLQEVLTHAQNCGNCGDTEADGDCKNLRSDLNRAEGELVEFEKHVAADRKLIAASP